VIAALWLAEPGAHRARRWLVAAAAVAFLFPNIDATFPGTRHLSLYHARYPTPAFFTTGLYRRYLRRDEIVLPLPSGYSLRGYSLLWQARAHMYFRLASGSFGYVPASYRTTIEHELLGHAITADAPSLLRSFILAERVSVVVADPPHSRPWLGVLGRLGLRPVSAGGVLVYRIPTAWQDHARGPVAGERRAK
jgi:hypothetical protein